MKVTNAYAAKRVVFARLGLLAAAGQPLEGWQTAYSWPGATVQRACIYGGAVTFDQEQAAAEPGLVVREIVTVNAHIRISDPSMDVSETDQEAEAAGDVVAGMLAAEPELAGGLTYIGIVHGQGDYQPPTEDMGAVSILSLRIQVEGHLT